MKFALDCTVEVGETSSTPSALLESIDQHREALAEVSGLEGVLLLVLDGKQTTGADYSDPILRLAGTWLRKVPWVIGGDTETVALRNSEHCFAFVPAGNGVEISFFEGDEAEIEEYVIDPTTVRLEDFAEASIGFGDRVVALVEAIDPALLESNEDCQDLKASLEQAREAWHDYTVHQRR